VNNGEYKIYRLSGNNKDQKLNYGIAIIVNKVVEDCVTGFMSLSDRVMMLNIASEVGVVNIIQAYAPTADKKYEEVEMFYEDIKTLLTGTKRHNITMVLDDFNVKAGSSNWIYWSV